MLRRDLEAHRGKAHIFIFMHHPVMPAQAAEGLDRSSVDFLKGLFKGFTNISYVVSGHEHMYYNPQGDPATAPPPGRTDPSQPPDYLISGGAGAPLENLPGAFYHYLVFKVDGSRVSVSLVRVQATPAPCDKSH